LIDKAPGPTSAEIVRQVKRRLGKRVRVGHLGTLDPFATGLLPILVGEGTKLAPFLQEGVKEYRGQIALGSETDTLDPTGEVVRSAPLPDLEEGLLDRIAAQFTGTIEQTPPIFSAIKRGGVRLYRLARLGTEVEPPAARRVEITRLELRPVTEAKLEFDVACSSGMYVRSLARDIGIALGTVAHLSELIRVRNGAFVITQAHPLTSVLAALESHDHACLVGMREALPGLPEVAIDENVERRLRNGDSRVLDHLGPADGGLFKLVSDGKLVAIGQSTSRVTAAIARVFGANVD
ncbi:MAG TPA: tRNA pseudouridine(55) synthase TruB, partial [Candidatus Binataceae bacterium]|nr:tRNA pseudouridine(55) synthase TruB [Candidatus Binataceae bacterium]